MSLLLYLQILFAVFFVLPIVAYMVMKFGTAGYLRARRRAVKHTKRKEEEEEICQDQNE